MRGMYTAGVLDIFLDHNITVDGVIGVSAGALFGVNYLSQQRGRTIRYNKRFNRDKHYLGLHSLIHTGNIVNTDLAYGTVPRKLDPFDDKAFMASGIPFYAGITSIKTGTAKYVKINSVFEQMDVLRASASMPFVSTPVNLNGHYYLDGAIADSIPYRKMFSMGYDNLIVILTRDRSYQKTPMSKTLIKLFYGKHPAFANTLYNRHKAYNNCLQELETLQKTGNIFIIRPSRPINIGRIEKDPAKLQQVYDIGIHDGTAAIKKLQQFMTN